MNQETKVGFFLVAALVTIMGSILMLGNVKIFSSRARYFVEFKDVDALPPKAAVKIAGVEIGQVEKVRLVKGKALVTIRINKDIALYEDASSRIGSTGIIGTRFVELFTGTDSLPLLQSDATIKGQTTPSLNDMIAKVSSLFEEDGEYGNSVGNIKATLANIRRVSEALDQALGNHARDMEAIVLNIRDLTESGKVFMAHLEEISTERKDDVKIALAKFKDISIKLDDVMTKIQSGKGTIGTLVNDEKTAADVKEAVASIKDTAQSAKKVMSRFTKINTYWNYRLRYDTRDDEAKSDIAITFVPKPGKYYAIGATNVGEVPVNEKHTEFERKNRIMATIGADYGPFTGYVGAIRSRGGAGLNFRPLWKNAKWGRRLELNAEASDFVRDRVVKGRRLEGAWVAAGAHMAITNWWWLGVRGEDLMERAAFMVYTNINFRDEDFAYLLGLASVAR